MEQEIQSIKLQEKEKVIEDMKELLQRALPFVKAARASAELINEIEKQLEK